MAKDSVIFRILQGASFGFQAFQVLRYGALVLGAIMMTWLFAPSQLIQDFETLIMVGGATTFFWVGGLLDGYLLLQKSVDPFQSSILQQTMMRFMFLMGIGSALVCALVLTIWYAWIPGWIVAGFCIYFLLETWCQAMPYYLIANSRGIPLLLYGVFSAGGYCLSIVVPLWAGWGMDGIIIALLAVSLLKFAWMAVAFGAKGTDGGRPLGMAKQLWVICGPLMLSVLLSQSAVYIDGFLVQRYFMGDFVDFRYGAKEFPLVLLLANSMSIVRAGEIAGSVAEGRVGEALQALKRSSSRLMWMLFPLAIGLLVVSEPLFDWVFRGRFPHAVPIFDLFLLLTIPRLMFPQTVARGYHKTFAMSISSGIELVINVLLSLVLMQYFGIAGIAGGTVLAFFAEKLVLLGYTEFVLRVSWRQYASLPLFWGWSLALLVAWIVKYALLPGW